MLIKSYTISNAVRDLTVRDRLTKAEVNAVLYKLIQYKLIDIMKKVQSYSHDCSARGCQEFCEELLRSHGHNEALRKTEKQYDIHLRAMKKNNLNCKLAIKSKT